MKRAVPWVIAVATTSVACALVTNLDDLGGGSDASDASCSEVSAPCLTGLDTRWQPVAVTLAGCAPGWTPLVLRTNPRLNDAGCACGACAVVPTGDCDASSPITTGNNCADVPIAQAPPGKCTIAAGQHVEAHGATLQATCTAASDGGKGADSDEIDLCVPGCNSNYCGTANRCVIADGLVACPNGFTLYAAAGTAATQDCPVCACTVTTSPVCKGTVTAFETADCSDAGLVATYALDTCNVFSPTKDYQSVLVNEGPPTSGACSTSMSGGPADAGLVGTKTICCQ